MTYSFQTFTSSEVLSAAKLNQTEVNIRDHSHGVSAVSLPPVYSKTASYTVVASDMGGTLTVNASGGAIGVTLSNPATLGNGFRVQIIKTDVTTNEVTVYGTINGISPVRLNKQYDSLTIKGDGSSYYLLDGLQDVDARLMGIRGDNTDCSTSFRNAINTLNTAGGGRLFLPRGNYSCNLVDVGPGITIEGEGGGTVITRPNSSGNWARTLTMQNSLYSSSVPSAPFILRNLVMDGNRSNQGSFHAGEIQQSHLLFVDAASGSTGKVNVFIDNVLFRNSPADGLSIYRNCDVKVNNSAFHNCWRGGVTTTGGNTRLLLNNVTITGQSSDKGYHTEVDGIGADGTFKTDISISGLYTDVSFVHHGKEGAKAIFSNVEMDAPVFFLNCPSATALFNNSKLIFGVHGSQDNRIVAPYRVSFNNCDFELYELNNTGNQTFSIHVYYNAGGTTYGDEVLTFSNCRFRANENLEAGDTANGIYIEGDNKDGNTLIVNDSLFDSTLDKGVHFVQGLYQAHLENNKYYAASAIYANASGTFPLRLSIQGGEVGSSCTEFIDLVTGTNSSVYKFRDFAIDEDQNIISNTAGFTNPMYRGQRVVYSDTHIDSGTNTGGFPGDIWRLNAPVAAGVRDWVCVTGAASGATWKALTSVSTVT